MKRGKFHKKENTKKLKDEVGEYLHHSAKKNEKQKYKHKNYWMSQEEDDFQFLRGSYKDEEE